MMNIDLLFQQLYRPLCIYALHYLQDTDASEDVVQDAFVRLIEKMQDGHQVDNTKSYLYTSVRNSCIDILRKGKQTESVILPQDTNGPITDEEAAERSLHEAELWTAIDTLPKRCREVFLMAKRDGRKYREIAETLNISEKTVEHQVSKALKILRGKADDFFYILSFVA